MTLVIRENLNSTFQASYRAYNRRTGVMGSSVGGANVVSLRRYRTDDSVKTPNFKRLKPRQLPINPYTKHVEILSDPMSTWDAAVDSYPVTPTSAQTQYYYIGNCQSLGVSTSALGSCDDPTQRAISKLLSKLSEGKTNTLVTMAEYNKTAAHVTKTATRIYRAVKALRRGEFGTFTKELGITTTVRQRQTFNKRFDRAASLDAQDNRYRESTRRSTGYGSRVNDFAADTWLEYKYGWKPLLKDVYDHAQALAELSISRSNVVRYASASAKTDAKFSKKELAGGGLNDLIRKTSVQRFVKIGVSYKLQAGELNTFNQLGINNPMEVAWELLPFSFVADWFLPVGQFLSSLTATQGLVFHSGYKSIRNVSQTDTTAKGNGLTVISGGVRYGPLSGGPTASWFVMDQIRYVLTDFPVPLFPGFRDPRDSKDGGLAQATSAIALLQSLFLRGK